MRQKCSSYCSTVSPTSRRRYVGMVNDKSSSACISAGSNAEHRYFEGTGKGLKELVGFFFHEIPTAAPPESNSETREA